MKRSSKSGEEAQRERPAASVTGEDPTALLLALPNLERGFRGLLEAGERRALRLRDLDAQSRRPTRAFCPACGAAMLSQDPDCWSCRAQHDDSGELFIVIQAPPRIVTSEADRDAVAEELVAEHVTRLGGGMPRAVRSATHRQVVSLLGDGCDPTDMRAGLDRMRAAGLGLAKLPELVVEAQGRRVTSGRQPWDL